MKSKIVQLQETDTEDAVSLAFERANAARYRFNATRDKWLFWNGKTWSIDDTGLVSDAIRAHCRSSASPHLRKAASVRGIESFCRASRDFACVQADFDADPWLLGTPGGTVDLKTGKMRLALPCPTSAPVRLI